MKILQLAPLVERVPPKKYGGTERVVYALTEELVKRGHEVTLFATGDSITSARLVSVFPKSLREAKEINPYGLNVWTTLNIGLAYNKIDSDSIGVDIIHDHHSEISLPTANICRKPVVYTLHGTFDTNKKKLYEKLNKPYVVSISKSQIGANGTINHIGNVYNGLSMNNYPFSLENDGYLLYVGRISMEKGIHSAVEVARVLNLPLIIAAKLENIHLQYFREYIEPYLSEQIQWIGEVDETKRNKLMSRALCFLHPVTWKEPFGLTLIEAMACGCPVVAFRKGSIPEIIINGKTGFVVEDVEEMIKAVVNINVIDRKECRKHALENFNSQKMADGYEKIYKKILDASLP